MPELPEVQIQVELLQPLRGQTITGFQIRDRKLRLPARLTGQRIESITRRAKYILFTLSSGDRLLAHLRMTGWFVFEPPPRYRVALSTKTMTVFFADSRRFGTLRYLTRAAADKQLAALGPEPLADDFDPACLRQTTRAIKVALLDQRLVAGVGNIYACEALWRARINPRRSAKRLTTAQCAALGRALRAALRKGLAYGPRIFEVQEFCVYDRAGKPCRRCRTPIRRFVQAQRGTWRCPQCQR